MGRAKSVNLNESCPVTQIVAISGTTTVMLAWDIIEKDREGLLGFSIRRRQANQDWEWLNSGGKKFPPSEKAVQEEQVDDNENSTRSNIAPIQAFMWNDYTAAHNTIHDYAIHAFYSGGVDPHYVSVTIKTESNQDTLSSHRVFFNKGVAGSQAFSKRFPASSSFELTADAKAWLSNGLAESLISFIDGALPGDTLRGAFYEFTFQPALQALARAHNRGVEVKVVVDCTSKGAKSRNTSLPEDAGGESTRVDLDVAITIKDKAKAMGARFDWDTKKWYAPAELDYARRKALAARFGKRNSRLAADDAIDTCGHGLREVIIRRERKGGGIPHNKFLIHTQKSGDSAVWMGSANLTDSAMYGQANVAHIIRDKDISDAYTKYWEKLSTDPTTGVLREWNILNSKEDDIKGNWEGAKVFMSPRSKSSKLLTSYADMLGEARQQACLTAAFGVNKLLADKLEQQTGEGGARRYILKESSDKKDDTFSKLSCNRVVCGAVLKESVGEGFVAEQLTGLNDHVAYVHTKFMLLDPLSATPVVITGSGNFSYASIFDNDENMVVIKGNTRCADLYYVEFMRLFRHFAFRDYIKALGAGRSQNWTYLATDESWISGHFHGHKFEDRRMILEAWVPASNQQELNNAPVIDMNKTGVQDTYTKEDTTEAATFDLVDETTNNDEDLRKEVETLKEKNAVQESRIDALTNMLQSVWNRLTKLEGDKPQ
eukprot:m.148654 g.148654  ORF g.148654 m.148654 type:complete len:715 (-) comp15002_c0_seq2:1047-3191(-)